MKKKMTKHKFNMYVLIYGLVIFIIVGMTIGFAYFNQIIGVTGSSLVIKVPGKLVISNVSLVSSSNVDTTYLPIWTDDSIDFNTRFVNNDSTQDCVATYDITFTNNGAIDYALETFSFSSLSLSNTQNGEELQVSLSGSVGPGYIFSPGESAVATVTIQLLNATSGGTYDVGGDVEPEIEIGNNYSIEAAITSPTNKTGDLRSTSGNVRVPFTLDVISTYTTATNFTLSLNSGNYRIVDSNGTAYATQTIAANDESNYTFYVEIVDPTRVTTNQLSLGVILGANGQSKIVDYITLLLDAYVPDTTPPVISNLSFAQSSTYADRGQGTLTWIGSDDSNITSYTIIKYEKLSGASAFTSTTISGVTSTTYPLTNLVEDATYYFKVYGEDQHGNSGASYADGATTGSGHCMATLETTCEWVFTVTRTLQGLTAANNTANTVNLGAASYTLVVTANNNYNLPTSANNFSVTMGGTTLTSGVTYTYTTGNNARGTLTIAPTGGITGALDIQGSGDNGGCLLEGTKIRLFDGTEKNIEDIQYDDLLAVWSYEEGRVIPDYPIWIEKKQLTNQYQLAVFEDGSELRTYSFHGIFDSNRNEFISVDDVQSFQVGTEVVKIDTTGNIYTTKVKEMKQVNEKAYYYNVISTKYFNTIANGFLVTDGNVIFSNAFGFEEKITWPSSRYELIANSKNVYSDAFFLKILPAHLVKGFRAVEAKVICENGEMPIGYLVNYLRQYILNPAVAQEPMQDQNGNNLWMMTTSEDDCCGQSKEKYLYLEGSDYILPEIEVKEQNGQKACWYNAVTNEYYECGETIKVEYAMHFEVVYR